MESGFKLMNSLKGRRKMINLMIVGEKVEVLEEKYYNMLNTKITKETTENDVMFKLVKWLGYMKVDNKVTRYTWL
jgi:hypothetical protein